MEQETTRDGRLLLIKLGPLGQFANNAYIVVDDQTHDALIIDAPQESERTVEAARDFNVGRIIVTHRHRDHWGGIEPLLAGIHAPVYTHEEDREPYASYVTGTLAHDEEVDVGALRLRILHTPGHSPGHICILVGDHLLTGDCLFPGGPGRTQSPEHLAREIESIKTHLYVLPDATHVYPGHGANTTIGASKQEYAVFAAKQHDASLAGDVLWLTS